MSVTSRPRLAAFCAVVAAIFLGLGAAAYGLSSRSSSSAPASAPAVGLKTIAYTKVIDLSHVITTKIPLWPGDPKVVFKVVATMKKDGYYLRSFTIGEHSATHMNAPNSFIAGNKQAITSYTPEQRVVPAVVIDVRSSCGANADYQLTEQDVLDWEAQYGQIAPGSFVIMLTGWEDKWNHPKAFINQDAKGNLHFPGFAGATSKWLVTDRQIAGVGIDTHGVDPGADTSYATNTEMAATHNIAIECMAHLDQLPPKGATLVLGALQLQHGSGTPLSIIAFVP
jgi:kynurenine formamidase